MYSLKKLCNISSFLFVTKKNRCFFKWYFITYTNMKCTSLGIDIPRNDIPKISFSLLLLCTNVYKVSNIYKLFHSYWFKIYLNIKCILSYFSRKKTRYNISLSVFFSSKDYINNTLYVLSNLLLLIINLIYQNQTMYYLKKKNRCVIKQIIIIMI